MDEEFLITHFPLLKGSLTTKSLLNMAGIRSHLNDYAENLKSEIKDQASVWYSDESSIPEIFGVLLNQIRIDFKYLPKLSMENMATLTVECRNNLRNYNRQQPEWRSNYCASGSNQKSIPSMLIGNFETLIKFYQVSLENMYAAITTRNLIKIIFDIQSCIIELLELGLWSATECKILIVIQQKMCQVFELDYEVSMQQHKTEYLLPYYIS